MEPKEWTLKEMQIISRCERNYYLNRPRRNTGEREEKLIESISMALGMFNFHRTADEIKYFFAVKVPEMEKAFRKGVTLEALMTTSKSSTITTTSTKAITSTNKTAINKESSHEKSICNEKHVENSKEINKLEEIKQEYSKSNNCSGITNDDIDNSIDYEPETSETQHSNNSELVELSPTSKQKINNVKSPEKEGKPLCKDKVPRKRGANNVKKPNNNCNSSPSDQLAQKKNDMNAVNCLPEKCNEAESFARTNKNNRIMNNKTNSGNTTGCNGIKSPNKECLATEHKNSLRHTEDKQLDGSTINDANRQLDNIEDDRMKQQAVTGTRDEVSYTTTTPVTTENKKVPMKQLSHEKSLYNEECMENSKQNDKLEEKKQEHTKNKVCTIESQMVLPMDKEEQCVSIAGMPLRNEFIQNENNNKSMANLICHETEMDVDVEKNSNNIENLETNESSIPLQLKTMSQINTIEESVKSPKDFNVVDKNDSPGIKNIYSSKECLVGGAAGSTDFTSKETNNHSNKIPTTEKRGQNCSTAKEHNSFQIQQMTQGSTDVLAIPLDDSLAELSSIQIPGVDTSKIQKDYTARKKRKNMTEERKEYLRVRNRTCQRFSANVIENSSVKSNAGLQIEITPMPMETGNLTNSHPDHPISSSLQVNPAYKGAKTDDAMKIDTNRIPEEIRNSSNYSTDPPTCSTPYKGVKVIENTSTKTDNAMKIGTTSIPEETETSSNFQADHSTSSTPYKDYYTSDEGPSKLTQETSYSELKSLVSLTDEATCAVIPSELISETLESIKELVNSECKHSPLDIGRLNNVFEQIVEVQEKLLKNQNKLWSEIRAMKTREDKR